MDDLELLKQYAHDASEEAFGTLVSRHVDMVYSVALRQVGNPDNATEIAQAVFVILARKSRQLCGDVVLAAWLYQTTRLTAGHWLRTEVRRTRREQEVYMQSLSNVKGPDIWERVAPMLEDAIAGLGEKDRNAIVCRFFQGKSLAQVGAALGTSEDAAHKRVNRAVEKLRNFYVKRGIAISAGTLAAALTASSVHAAPVGLASAIAASATLSGAMAAGPTLTLVKGTLKIMAWTKLKMAVLGSAALILAFGGSRMAATSHGFDYKTVSPLPPTTAANAPTAAGSSKSLVDSGLRWENIESSDYRQYIANMRAAGIPEAVIRDIVIADLHKNYAAKIRAVLGSPSPYWQKHSNKPDPGNQKQIMALKREESDVAALLFGQKLNIQQLNDQLVVQHGNDLNASVAWLPPQKRDGARRAFEEAGLPDPEAFSAASGTPSDAFAKILALLNGILTPAELEEYKLRESPSAASIRQDFHYADLTPDEFKAVLEVREQFPAAQQIPGLRTEESVLQQSQALEKLLGKDRANEIRREGDSAYCWMRQAAERYDLPVEAADRAFKLKTDTEGAMMKIIDDPSLSKIEKEQQFNALQTTAKTAFVNCLGTKGAKLAYNGGASWLFFDLKSYLLGRRPRP